MQLRLTIENKRVRFKANDFLSEPYTQSLMMKFWKISLAAVYRSVEEGELIGIKLPIENFQVILSLFKKALG